MAINPLLLNVKPISEITTVNNPIKGHLLFYDGSDELKKVDIIEFQSLIGGIAKPLAIADATPTTAGWYKPTTSGTYANAGGLVAQEGYDTLFYFDGTTWSLIATDLPQPIVNNYTNNNTYNLDPEQIVPSEALYTDDTLAGDIIKRVDINTGENVNYRETTTWQDGTEMNDSKIDGVIFIKKNNKYIVDSDFISGKPLSILKWGAKGDGITDDKNAIQAALDFANNKGVELIVPKTKSDFILSDLVYIGSKTTLTFRGSFFKLSGYTTIGTVLLNKPNSTDIIINNPLIDGNNITAGGTGENGISMYNVKGVRIYDGVIKNCKKGTEANKLGGKGFQFESINIEDVIIDGTRIENCSWAISSQYDIVENNALGGTKIEVKFNNIYAKDCENLGILHQMNGEASDKHNVEINNITSIDCGNNDGLLIVGKLKNLKLNGATVVGNPITGGFIRGRHSNCSFKNIKILQNMSSLIWNEPTFHEPNYDASVGNNYEFLLQSDVDYILKSSNDSSYSNRELKESHISVITDREDFDFSLPQASHPTLNFEVKTNNKHILINSTDAVLLGKNTPSAFNQPLNIGNGRKIKSGTTTPNEVVIGNAGDLYLQESNGYTNIWFKYFGDNTNTGWNLISPLLSSINSEKPPVSTIGVMNFNITSGKPEWWNGLTWVEAFKKADSQSNSIATDVATLVNDFNYLLSKLKTAGIMTDQPT